MTELNTETIAGRIKRRAHENARSGRVGGTDHQKKIMLRHKEAELRKRRKNRKIEC